MTESSKTVLVRQGGGRLSADYASATKTDAKVARLENLPQIDLGLGHSPYGMPPAVKDYIKKHPDEIIAAAELYNGSEDRYGDTVAEQIRSLLYLSNSPYVSFHSGAGSYALLYDVLAKAIPWTESVETGVVCVAPSFPNFKVLTDMVHWGNGNGAEQIVANNSRYLSLQPDLGTPYDLRLEALASHRLADSKSKVTIIDVPCNPTGEIPSNFSVRRLAEATNVPKRGGIDLLVIDVAYGNLSTIRQLVQLTEEYRNILVIGGGSKLIGMPGFGFAYTVCSPGDVAEAYKKTVKLVFDPRGVGLLIAKQVFRPEVLEPFIDEITTQIQTAKRHLIDGLMALNILVYPTNMDVPIMLVKAPNHPNFARFLGRHGVIVESGGDFREVHEGMDNSMVRIRIPKDKETVNAALDRIKAALDEETSNPNAWNKI